MDGEIVRHGFGAQLNEHPADSRVLELLARNVFQVHTWAQPHRRRHGVGRRVVLEGAVAGIDQRHREVRVALALDDEQHEGEGAPLCRIRPVGEAAREEHQLADF